MMKTKLLNIFLLSITIAVVLIGFLSVSTAMTLIRINTTEDKLRKTLVQKEQTIVSQRAEIDNLKQELTEQRNIVKDLKDKSVRQTNIILDAVSSRKELGYVKRLPGYRDLTFSQQQAIAWLLDETANKENKDGKFFGDTKYDFDFRKSRMIDRIRKEYLSEKGMTDLQSLDCCYLEIRRILDDRLF